MQHAASDARLELAQGNIVAQAVDAVANAADSALLGGGGATLRRAGQLLTPICATLGGVNRQ